MVENKNEGKEKTQVPKEERLHTTEGTSISEYSTSDADSNKSLQKDFPIIGIGASVGGLAAFEAFFSAIPDNIEPGMAFVLVQHLDPNHKSILTDLIRRYTRMPVYEVEDGMFVQPNSVYVIPPSYNMVLEYGTLQLKKPAKPHGQRLPIDLFFRSLAQSKQELSIGIILSGTGSDGTLGVRAIKAEGGMVVAQSPESSEYDGMPRSAIATGLVDYILPPAEMPTQLMSYVTEAFGNRPQVVTEAGDVMKKIFDLLYIITGHDLSHYKKNTINRRIERRMTVKNIKSVDEYAHYLDQNHAEVEALFHDLLIGVTSFFRNPTAFEALQQKVIPDIFTGKHPDSVIRIWVPGCSTGEEAYSLGILFQEQMEMLKRIFKIQIFATDIDSRAIEQARNGVYPLIISIDVSPERLNRFFTQDSDGNYRIQKNIRDMIIFSEQDIIVSSSNSRENFLTEKIYNNFIAHF